MELSGVYIQLGILFVLMLTGYILGKIKLLPEEGNAILSEFVVKVALPAIIISSMCMPITEEHFRRVMLTIGLSILVYGIVIILAWCIPRFITKNMSKQGILSFAILFSNCGFMGFPVLGALLGDEAIFYVSIYNMIFNILLFTVGVKFLQEGKAEKSKFNIKLLISPGIVASLIGLVIFFSGLMPPSFIVGALDSIGSTCTPLSMIIIGSMLSQKPIGKMFGDKTTYILAVIRLFILPFMVFFLLKFILKLQDDWLIIIPTVIAGMPVASNAAMMAKTYDTDAEYASQLILITTLIGCISIPILIYFL